jgi:nucleoside-diphosphate-sugar epimerase
VRILVTGVSGYVGAALVPRLRAAEHEVRGFARSRTSTSPTT